VCKERHLPYDRPPLSKEFLRGEKRRDEITYDAREFFDERGIRVMLGDPVVHLDAAAKVAGLGSGETVRFHKALLATGGEPVRLGVPGGGLPGIQYLRTVDDSEAIKRAAVPGGRACVVGAGFIGMELAASLTHLGVEVTVIEALPHIWARFLDETISDHIRRFCEGRGISFLTGERIHEFRGEGRVSGAITESGRQIECDFVCVGVGIRPDLTIAHAAGLVVENGVVVNEKLETSRADIFAAGDIANFPDPVTGRRRRVEHWGHAEYSGQIAGSNMAGAAQAYDLLTYAWSDIFELHIEFAGDETGYDRILVRGSLDANIFTALYLTNDVLTAYLSVNTDSREFPHLQKLIRRKTHLAGRDGELADPVFDLKALL
jgi:NADPH-dependent 2,4-dienoyl-CoA reductase/sulfur reductase-like enzyme